MNKVVITQVRMTHYRTELFERLRSTCFDNGIELHVQYGQPSIKELSKKDEGYLPWADKVRNYFFNIAGIELVWQPAPNEIGNTDLIIITQENRILSNYYLLLKSIFSTYKIAYWGHGVNFQSNNPNRLRDKWKRLMLTHIDWWFAYTEKTTEVLQQAHYPKRKTTCLNNTIDTNEFKINLSKIENSILEQTRTELGIDKESLIGLFCGSLYENKRLDLLIDATDQIHALYPDFHCLIMGDGSLMQFITEAASIRPWIHILGLQKGLSKALYFRMSDFMLNPGAVGLNIIDAFCAGLIMITTSDAKHGPEISYIKNGSNAFITESNVEDYAAAILELIKSSELRTQIKKNALKSSELYDLNSMVENFYKGIKSCLANT